MERMKRFLVVVMAVVALCAVAQVERPKLVVGLVVDQMRWDYLYNYQWGEGGFKTLLTDGYLCNNAIIDYVLKENLKDYGWSIAPPSSRKERKRAPELFDSV